MVFVNIGEYADRSGIYIIRNIINGSVYVGQTTERFIRRYWHHRWNLNEGKHCNSHLQSAYGKYGAAAFEFEAVECCGPDDINRLEMQYIKSMREITKVYNITDGGGGRRGSPVGEDTRRAIGEKNRVHMTGRKASEETREKMRKSNRHHSPTAEHRESLREYMKNRTVTEATREKLRLHLIENGSPSAKVTIDEVGKIKTMLVQGMTQTAIKDELNISYGIVHAIAHARTWNHVDVPGWGEFLSTKA